VQREFGQHNKPRVGRMEPLLFGYIWNYDAC
jgi:hypothetical protein